METEQAMFILRSSRPDHVETEHSDFGDALALAEHDQELREWLVAEHTRDSTFAAALRAVPVPASLRRELSIGMEWSARFGNTLNPLSAWAKLRHHFGSNRGGRASPRREPHDRIPTEHLP